MKGVAWQLMAVTDSNRNKFMVLLTKKDWVDAA